MNSLIEKQEKMVKNAMAKQQQNLARLSPQTNVLPATREGNSRVFLVRHKNKGHPFVTCFEFIKPNILFNCLI